MRALINKVIHAPAKIRIGKKGLTENIITEIQHIIKKDQVIKVKCLKVVPKESIPAIANNIAELTDSKVVEIRGKTFILIKSTKSEE